MSVRRWISVGLALFVMSGVACSGDDELGDMMVRAVGGGVEIHRGDEIITVDGDEALEPQDIVVTDGSGLARLNLEAGRSVMLQRASRVRVRSSSTIEGQKGRLLAFADSTSMTVLFDDVRSNVSDGVFRLDRGFGSSRAASYAGTVELESPGQAPLSLDPLFQVNVAAGDLPDTTTPYELKEQDPWDARYLEEVVALTHDLDLLATGFSRQLSNSRPSLGYFSGLVGRDDLGFMRRYLSRSPAELLVGFTVATNDPDLSLRRSFEKAFDLRDRGARWGVAATILEVRTNPLVAQLQQLILGTGVVASTSGGTADFTFAGAEAPGAAGSSDVTDPGGTGVVIEGSTDEEDQNGGAAPPPAEQPDDCGDFVTCTQEDIEDEIPPGPGDDPDPEPTSKDVDLLDDPPGP